MPLCLLKQIICLSNKGRKCEQEQTAPDLLFSLCTCAAKQSEKPGHSCVGVGSSDRPKHVSSR